MYMASMQANISNFRRKHRGKVVGILEASFSSAPVYIVYGIWFGRGHVSDEENQDLKGFYLAVTICFAVTGLLGVLFLKEYPVESEEIEFTKMTDFSEDDNEAKHGDVPDGQVDVTGVKLLKNFNFHFLFWATVFCLGFQLTFGTNITTFLKSYDLEEYSSLLTIIFTIFTVLAKFFIGALSDALLRKVPRIALLFGLNILQTITMIICIFFSNHLPVIIIALLVTALSSGALWCLTPTIFSEYYGTKHFSRNWSMVIFGNAASGFILLRIFGWIYDSSISYVGQTVCFGLKCFTWSFATLAVLSACSCIFNAGFLENEIRGNRRTSGNIR